MKKTLSGFSYFFEAISWLNKPGVRRFVIIPLILNIIVFALLFSVSGHFYGELLSWVDSKLPSWLAWINWILWPLFFISASLFLFYTFTLIANIIGAPFNSFLSEKVELLKTGQKINEDEGMLDALKDIPRTVTRQFQIIFYYIPRMLLLLILFLIPGINVIASLAWFLFSAWTLAMQYLDYPMDNHKVPVKTMREEMKDHRWTSLSFGCVVMLATLIPIVNFFVMPVAVIGATLMYLDFND